MSRCKLQGRSSPLSTFCFVFCFGGFKGQVRWPKGPPHLALNPPCLLVFLFFFGLLLFLSFLCFVIPKKPCFHPRKGHFLFIFECLPLFLFSFFGAPPFSIFLSLFLSSSCPSFLSFLSFFFVFFCFLVLSLSFFLSSLLLFREKNNIRIFNYKVFLHQYFLFFGFLSSFLFEIPFSYLCFFADFKLCFRSTSLFLVSKNTS